ncbi:amino acid ABC transporter substrate-binding protein [Desulfosarcina alkanivorans]|uniref:Amino acid ABC transporter substrate-binding protein n=1 Tax=Desulfosarcina alkanivorans TaxID=571177 RepID=A0A5K7YI90_9BACT|nr:transporter substrate-binding domain-containing protein [Desulfosarcina alkanivorans]BBO68658.1 amino acid ABC transporter substrate-binding protein [Desulfosarcina alkanivorans]
MGMLSCCKAIIALILSGIWLGLGAAPAPAADVAFSKGSALEGILKRGELRIGLEVGYMPFEMIDKRSGLRQKAIRHGGTRRRGRQLSLMGFDIDVGIEMAKALGVKPVFVDTMWPSIIPALNLGRFDIIFGGMSVTESRKEKVDFADPFMTVGQTILLNARHKETVQSYKDLNNPGFVVVSKPGTTGEEAVQRLIPKAAYETADTEIEGAMRVLEGTADAFVYDFPFNAVFRALHPSNELVFLDEPFTEEPIAWAIRKNDPDFMKFLNGFLARLKADGRFDQIYFKWFLSSTWHRFVR